MKSTFSRSLLAGGLLLLGLAACTKVAYIAYTGHGTSPSLNASATSVAPTVSDSLSVAVVFSWTDPKYQAPFPGPALFTIEIDSMGHNFAQPTMLQVSGVLQDSLLAKDLNSIVLSMGGAFGVPYTIEVKVVSSYANNNDPLNSNVLTIKVTPYKTPPKVQPPTSGELYLVGSATAGGWANPVDTVLQKFTQVDSVDYTGNFYLNGGAAYDILPVNGSWSVKYNVAAYGNFGTGGAFQYSTGPGADIPAPATSGIYTIKLNFQTGLFTVTPVQLYSLLWVPGDYQGWAPATAPTLASINLDGKYEGYVNITTTNGFKLTGEADWNGTIYGDTAKAGESGILTATNSNNMNIASTGTYWLQVDTKGNTWSATKITEWGLIGDFNGWSTDVFMTYSSANNNWTGSFTGAAAGGFKIRANAAWTLSYGTGGPDGSLTSNGGGNIPFTAGTHTITMSLATPGYYTVVIQ